MIQHAFIAATWLIATFGVLGACAVVLGVASLGPTAFIAIVRPLLVSFLECTWCVVVVVFALATTGAYWVGHHGEFRRGYDSAISDIAEENDAAIKRAVDKRNAWRACRSSGAQWDQSTGECS